MMQKGKYFKLIRHPRLLFKYFKEAFRNAYEDKYGEKKRFCPVCNQPVKSFGRLSDSFLLQYDKHQFRHSVFHFETFNLLEYSCPVCRASDRDRLYALYLREHLGSSEKRIQLVDFAPSPALQKFISSFPAVKYRSADLYMEGVDDRVDITNMPGYEENRFDMLICSHILEHIEDDKKAISELFRILKPGGKGIVMVPILTHLDSDYELEMPQTVEERWSYYGQDDHVRLYSKSGFIQKLTEGGFKVHSFGVDHFGADRFFEDGIHQRSVLYVVEKPLNN